jgi:hypothetical protein
MECQSYLKLAEQMGVFKIHAPESP